MPAVHGGRVAMRNEILATRAAGHDVFALAFHHGTLSPQELRSNQDLAGSFAASRRKSFAAATMDGPFLPYQVSSRVAEESALRAAIAWQPDLVICHHEWTLPTGAAISEARGGIPLIVRAHNDEHRYYKDLMRTGRGVRAPYYAAEFARVRRFLNTIGKFAVTEIWYMSEDDAASGPAGIAQRVIPPVMFSGSVTASTGQPPGQAVTFVGSLDVPHAVAGLQWFLTQAWPLVQTHHRGARLVIAGRRPTAQLASLIEATPNAELVANPESLDEVFAACRVFINPVFAGSGVNLKLGEPLRRALPVVTTTVGARGLPAASFSIADDAEGFAKACARLLADDVAWHEASKGMLAARQSYSLDAVGSLIGAAIAQAGAR